MKFEYNLDCNGIPYWENEQAIIIRHPYEYTFLPMIKEDGEYIKLQSWDWFQDAVDNIKNYLKK